MYVLQFNAGNDGKHSKKTKITVMSSVRVPDIINESSTLMSQGILPVNGHQTLKDEKPINTT